MILVKKFGVKIDLSFDISIAKALEEVSSLEIILFYIWLVQAVTVSQIFLYLCTPRDWIPIVSLHWKGGNLTERILLKMIVRKGKGVVDKSKNC